MKSNLYIKYRSVTFIGNRTIILNHRGEITNKIKGLFLEIANIIFFIKSNFISKFIDRCPPILKAIARQFKEK
jgi:hypothetical protein